MISANVDLGRLLKKLRRVPREASGIMRKAIETDARGTMLDIIAITPPGSPGALLKSGKKGEAAMDRARSAIRADLLGGRKVTKGSKAGIFMALDDGLIDSALATGMYQTQNVRLFVKKGGIVYGTDRSLFRPDAGIVEMDAHHHKYWKKGYITSAGHNVAEQIGRWKFVDKMVVRKSAMNKYLEYLYERIGIMAGGWGKGAMQVKARLPKAVKKHASGGVVVTVTASSFTIQITNTVRYFLLKDMTRRIQFVLKSGKREKRLKNSLHHGIRAALKKSQLTVA